MSDCGSDRLAATLRSVMKRANGGAKMKARRIATIAAFAAVAVTGVLAGAGSAGTNGIGSGNLVFSAVDPTDGASDIYVMKTSGFGKSNLTHDLGVRKDVSPSWSPNGKKIVFSRHSNTGGSSIMLVNADGTGLTNLTGPAASNAQNVGPRWSADGTRVVFASNRDGNFDLYWLKPGSPEAFRLTATAAPVQNLDPAWSPNGKTIVFSRSGHLGTVSGAELYQLNVGTQPTSTTGSATRLTKVAGGRGDRGPVYSPDGSSIAFYSDRSGNQDVYLLSRGGTPQRVTTSPKSDTEPSFSPDGTALVFVSDRTGATELWVSNLVSLQPGLQSTQITNDKQFKSHPGWAPAASDVPPAPSPVAIGTATGT
jgi:Tol biopolymer transport system component